MVNNNSHECFNIFMGNEEFALHIEMLTKEWMQNLVSLLGGLVYVHDLKVYFIACIHHWMCFDILIPHTWQPFLSLTHSILATTIVVAKNMLWMPSDDYSRRAFRYIWSSIFYTFPVFDHFVWHNLYPINW